MYYQLITTIEKSVIMYLFVLLYKIPVIFCVIPPCPSGLRSIRSQYTLSVTLPFGRPQYNTGNHNHNAILLL